jgi:hypothetical protein
MIISLMNLNCSRFGKSGLPWMPDWMKADENETHPLHWVGWKESCCFPSHTPAQIDNNPWQR